MKYIMLETKDGAKLPIIFPDVLTHVFVAGAMQLAIDTMDPKKNLRPRQLLSMLDGGTAKPISAGFINLGTEVVVTGASESLAGLASKPVDAARVVLGDAIQFMPDEMVEVLKAKLEDRVRSGLDSDLAIAIAEHAFRAGYDSAAQRAVNFAPTVVRDWVAAKESAWDEYTPPEELCGVALLKE